MGRKIKSLIGNKYGYLSVICVASSTLKGVYWLCVCDCGNEVTIQGNHLKSGNTKSCGCLRKSMLTTHGLSNTRLYSIWSNMISRCNNPCSTYYSNYGGRGITVCDRWLESFENFYEDMYQNYEEHLEIDRIDNNKGYYKENCKWSTKQEQSINKRKYSNNSSGKTGVCWDKRSNIWNVRISVNNKRLFIGNFTNIDDAIKAREEAELKYYGRIK